jgi:hypothetical protein
MMHISGLMDEAPQEPPQQPPQSESLPLSLEFEQENKALEEARRKNRLAQRKHRQSMLYPRIVMHIFIFQEVSLIQSNSLRRNKIISHPFQQAKSKHSRDSTEAFTSSIPSKQRIPEH